MRAHRCAGRLRAGRLRAAGPRWATRRHTHRGRHASARPRPAARLAVVGAVVLAVVAGLVVAGSALVPPDEAREDRAAAVSADDEPRSGGARQEALWLPERWLERFDADWAQARPSVTALSRSPDSWDHYPLAYSVDALTAAYRASGDTAYLEDGLALLEDVAASARPSTDLAASGYRDEYAGWVSSREDVAGQEVPLFESYLWRYGTHLLAVAAASPQASADPVIAARVSALTTFVERDVFDKWFSRGPEGTVYRERTHLSSHWAFIAMDLYGLTRDEGRQARCAEVVMAIVDGGSGERHSLVAQAVPSDAASGALFWSDEWGSYRSPGQDVAHGNNVIAFVVEADDRGVGWPADTVDGLRGTFTEVVWPRAGRGAEFVDGSGAGTGWFSDGWVKLGRYDADLQRRLQRHEVANGQFFANGALNAAILACDDAAASPETEQSPTAPACTPLPPWRQSPLERR